VRLKREVNSARDSLAALKRLDAKNKDKTKTLEASLEASNQRVIRVKCIAKLILY
jgi:hypothetical protein